jgi:hypothetical protein
LLFGRSVAELDPCVGPQFRKEFIIDGIAGVEDYPVTPRSIIDARGHR